MTKDLTAWPGRRISFLTVADDFSHKCVDINVDPGISGLYVTRLLDRAPLFRGYPINPATPHFRNSVGALGILHAVSVRAHLGNFPKTMGANCTSVPQLCPALAELSKHGLK